MATKKQWLSKDLFTKFKTEVQEDADKKTATGDSNLVWKNPEPGTNATPKEYRIRLLPDITSNFYKKFYYHMFKVNEESWRFSVCPKTFDPEAYCPICSVTAKLYKGSDDDKKEAQRFKRKEKFVTNVLIINDPRDTDKDDELKVSGKVKLYEFPSKVEQLIRSSIQDSENGVGIGAFDPKDGYNFILKVGLTKKDQFGKEWPNYETSTFARQPSAIADSDEEISEIIEKTADISEYLKKKLPNEEKVIEDLKAENVFELIEEDYNRKRKISKTITTKKVVEEDSEMESNVENESNDNYENESPEDENQRLLEELSNL